MPVYDLLFVKQVQFLRGGWISMMRQGLRWTAMRPHHVSSPTTAWKTVSPLQQIVWYRTMGTGR